MNTRQKCSPKSNAAGLPPLLAAPPLNPNPERVMQMYRIIEIINAILILAILLAAIHAGWQ